MGAELMHSTRVVTTRGASCQVLEGGSGAPLLYLHGTLGLAGLDPLLGQLGERYHVFAPEWPGYGDSTGEELLEDMLDFTLHGWDVADALGLERPALVGHSMGGMIAAEMACVCPARPTSLALVAPAGLWLDDHPMPDIFATLPHDLPALLFHDAAGGAAFLSGGVDFSDLDALAAFMVANAKRLGAAGKILFPIPNRRLSKRLYRLRTATLLAWGEDDRLMPLAYADRWAELVPHAELVVVGGAGHLLPVEQPSALAAAIVKFLDEPSGLA